MGMYDTLYFVCPNCGEESDTQTKLGECMLDNYYIGSKTNLPDGIFRAKDACTNCNHYLTFVVQGGVFLAILKDPPKEAKQEIPFSRIGELGDDPEEELASVVKVLKEAFAKLEENE